MSMRQSSSLELHASIITIQTTSVIVCMKLTFTCVLFVAAEVMFRRADYTVFESDLPVQFEVLLQPSALPDGDITIEIITVSGTATGMSIYTSYKDFNFVNFMIKCTTTLCNINSNYH